jgi:hypothetical protein
MIPTIFRLYHERFKERAGAQERTAPETDNGAIIILTAVLRIVR